MKNEESLYQHFVVLPFASGGRVFVWIWAHFSVLFWVLAYFFDLVWALFLTPVFVQVCACLVHLVFPVKQMILLEEH